MTDSQDKKSKSRRGSFDADLDALLDDAESSLSANEIVDEDAIDRLLIDDGFDLDEELSNADTGKFQLYVDDVPLSEDEFPGGDEEFDDLDLKLQDISAAVLNEKVESKQMQPPDAPIADINELADEREASVDISETAEDALDSRLQDISAELFAADLDELQQPLPDEQAADSFEPEEETEVSDQAVDVAEDALDSRLQDISAELFAADLDELQQPLPDEQDVDNSEPVAETEANHQAVDVAEDALDSRLQDISAELFAADLEELQQPLPDEQDVDSFEPVAETEASDKTDETAADELELKPQDIGTELPEELAPELADVTEPEVGEGALSAGPEFHAIVKDDLAGKAKILSEQAAAMVESDTVNLLDKGDEALASPIPAEPNSEEAEDDDLLIEPVLNQPALQADPEVLAEIDALGMDLIGEDIDTLPKPVDEVEDNVADAEIAAYHGFSDELIEDESDLANQIATDLLGDMDAFNHANLVEEQPEESDEFGMEIISDDAEQLLTDDQVTHDYATNEFANEFADEDIFPGFEQQEEFADTGAENLLDQQLSTTDEDFSLADFDITGDAEIGGDFSDIDGLDAFAEETVFSDNLNIAELSEPDFSSDDPSTNEEDDELHVVPVPTSKIQQEQPDAAGLAALAAFKAEQEVINSQQKKMLGELENKTKTSAMITYAALAFAVISLGTAIFLGVVAHSAKNEVDQLNEVITGLEQKQTDAEMAPVTAPAEAVADEDQEAKDQHTEEPPEADNAKADEKEHATESQASEKTTVNSSEHQEKSAEPSAAVDVKPAKARDDNSFKPGAAKPELESAGKVEKSAQAEPKPSVIKGPIKKPIVFLDEQVKKPEQKQETAAKAVLKKKPAKPAPEEKKEKPLPKVVAAGDWAVNLIAFKQDWFAKAKANEFRQKGVPVEVVPVVVDNVTWYRLRVAGFNGRQEASGYAVRVKKALNLSSVWVSK